MKVAGIFAGIGGLEVGLAQSGHTATVLAEILPSARAVLAAHLPHADLKSDVRELRDLPQDVGILTAGFPCQDLSLAGVGAGLKGERSGTFYPFWDVVRALKAEGRAPKLIALENVCGSLRASHRIFGPTDWLVREPPLWRMRKAAP